MPEFMTLVPVRTSRQGTSLNAGKFKDEYRNETSTVEIYTEDLKRLGLKKGDKIRLRSSLGREIEVNCKEKKGSGAALGMMFMAYGPSSSELMEDDTAGTGMPLSKHIQVEVEGPLSEEGAVITDAQTAAIGPAGSIAAGANSPLSQAQADLLNSLIGSSLSPMQMAWLSGFFAASCNLPNLSQLDIPAQSGMQPAAAGPALPLMTILYGSQTGNGEGLANQLKEKAMALGFNVTISDMLDYEPAKLQTEKILFVVVSTHGEGDPPDAAEELHGFLQNDEAPRLESLQYAVFALGDSSYDEYCKVGKDFDQFLSNLGAKPLLERVDADVDFEEPAAEWMEAVTERYRSIAEEAGGPLESSASVLSFPDKGKSQYTKTNPYLADVLVNRNMCGEGSAKETRHIEIDLGASGLLYEPGDSLGIYPKNNPRYVDELLAALNMAGSEQVTVGKGTLAIRDAFIERLDITALSRLLIDKYAALVGNDELKTLLADARKNDFKEYCWGRQLLDLVEDFPANGVSAQDFVGILRKMPGRLYSIASSLKKHDNQVHLVIAAVRYHTHERDREGVCSTFFSGRLKDREKLPVYVQQNKAFGLPGDNNALTIMVGPGTGVAPFRAYLEERQAIGATGKNWLYFGDQHEATDFLYREDWEQFQKDGVLTRLTTAFSRDQAEKVYVQHRLLENSKEVFAWLEEGAFFYVCGDAEYMAKDVHQTLLDIIAKEGSKSAEGAEEYLKAMQDAKRYQRDVY